jgi:hypothetical protein
MPRRNAPPVESCWADRPPFGFVRFPGVPVVASVPERLR